jgi:hypothetical protein
MTGSSSKLLQIQGKWYQEINPPQKNHVLYCVLVLQWPLATSLKKSARSLGYDVVVCGSIMT